MDWDRLSMIILIRPDIINFVFGSTLFLFIKFDSGYSTAGYKVVFLLQLPDSHTEHTELKGCFNRHHGLVSKAWSPGPRATNNRNWITDTGGYAWLIIIRNNTGRSAFLLFKGTVA